MRLVTDCEVIGTDKIRLPNGYIFLTKIEPTIFREGDIMRLSFDSSWMATTE